MQPAQTSSAERPSFVKLLKETFAGWRRAKAPQLAAALAYYTLFSLAPLLVIVIGIAGLVYGEDAAQGRLVNEISQVTGPEGAALIETMIASARNQNSGIIATLLGIVALLLGAGATFGHLKDALNTLWQAQTPPSKGLPDLVRARFLSFSMVLGTGFLLLVLLVVSAGISALGQFLTELTPVLQTALQLVDFALSFTVAMALFAMIYKFLPDVEIAWKNVWLGAALTAFLFTVGKILIGLYLGNAAGASVYGAAGSLVVLLLWIYYSAQISFFGAKFTQVYSQQTLPELRLSARPEGPQQI
jgi:membrane protein